MEIAVSDTGIGIKEENLDKIFTVFSQIEDVKTKMHRGTGLGLVISKNLADLIGGSISVASAFGKGTAFTLSLPIQNIERGGLYDME
jgi:signal transduction histidine kinase